MATELFIVTLRVPRRRHCPIYIITVQNGHRADTIFPKFTLAASNAWNSPPNDIRNNS